MVNFRSGPQRNVGVIRQAAIEAAGLIEVGPHVGLRGAGLPPGDGATAIGAICERSLPLAITALPDARPW
jgi:hypothetical protein